MLRNSKARVALAMLHDAMAVALAWVGAYLLRLNFELSPNFWAESSRALLWIVPLQMAVFWRFGLYRGIWRYASLNDLRRIVLAVLLAGLLIPFVLWMLHVNLFVPRAVLVLNPLLLILMMGGGRLLYRMCKETGFYGRLKMSAEPVLVLGAGDAAVMLSKDLAKNPAWQLVGFLDDDDGKQGCILTGALGGSFGRRARHHRHAFQYAPAAQARDPVVQRRKSESSHSAVVR